jgi:hypothetical protein
MNNLHTFAIKKKAQGKRRMFNLNIPSVLELSLILVCLTATGLGSHELFAQAGL